jgi:hypothetical protein
MSRLISFIAFIFPFAEPKSPLRIAADASLAARTDALIGSAKWDNETDVALEQANRIMDGELERRKSAEAKATTYLAVLAALVPVTLSIEAAEWEKKVGPAPEWLRLLILIIAVVYTAAAGWHAFRTLQVSGVHVIGAHDLALAWQTDSGPRRLARSTAKHITASQDAINSKVTSIKVTHEHLLRAFTFFILLLLLDPLAYQAQRLGILAPREKEDSSKNENSKDSKTCLTCTTPTVICQAPTPSAAVTPMPAQTPSSPEARPSARGHPQGTPTGVERRANLSCSKRD